MQNEVKGKKRVVKSMSLKLTGNFEVHESQVLPEGGELRLETRN